jgi:cephalosporin hydroxylase
MKRHFDTNINVKDLILKYRPRTILELGALFGENTVQILSLREIYPFKMITITDGNIRQAFKEVHIASKYDDYIWIEGISYKEIPILLDKTLEFALIDTDHNYWTLKKELEALKPKFGNKVIIVMHDTNGLDGMNPTKTYKCKVDYPADEIQKCMDKDLKITDAIKEFLDENQDFRMLRHSTESNGAVAIAKGIYENVG